MINAVCYLPQLYLQRSVLHYNLKYQMHHHTVPHRLLIGALLSVAVSLLTDSPTAAKRPLFIRPRIFHKQTQDRYHI